MTESKRLPADKNLQIMILEDHPFQLKFAKKLVESVVDNEVLVASDGSQAIEALKQNNVDCDIVFCDLAMEGMDGVEFIRRAGEENLAKAIVIASAAELEVIDTVSRMVQAHNIQLLGCIKKPFSVARVSELIQDYLNSNDETQSSSSNYTPQKLNIEPEDVLDGLNKNQFVPFYQAKYCIESKSYIGVEALARWQHPTHGLISPAIFIPIIESHGWDKQLTESILSQSLRDCKDWNKQGFDLSVAVNVTTTLINDNQFADFVKNKLSEIALSANKLLIEITESSVLQNSANSLETVSRLRLQQIQIAVDDYGTGFSSLEQLCKAPFSQLKLDRSFIQDIDLVDKNRVIVAHTIDLAKQLRLQTVAEGVERKEEVDVLTQLGADEIQGFFFAKPMPNQDFLNWLNKQPNQFKQ